MADNDEYSSVSGWSTRIGLSPIAVRIAPERVSTTLAPLVDDPRGCCYVGPERREVATTQAAEPGAEQEPRPRDTLRTGQPVELREQEAEGVTKGKRYVVIAGVRCLAKPAAGDPSDPHMIYRETAASAIADAAGWSDLIAPTVIRELDLGQGLQLHSVQRTWAKETNPPGGIAGYSAWDVERAAVLDIIMDNGDRRLGHNHLTNWFTGQPRLRLVDHGHAFGKQSGPSGFVSEAEGRPLSPEIQEGIERIASDAIDEVRTLLGDHIADQIADRAKHLLDGGVISRP
jgi:hypothetical protein